MGAIGRRGEAPRGCRRPGGRAARGSFAASGPAGKTRFLAPASADKPPEVSARSVVATLIQLSRKWPGRGRGRGREGGEEGLGLASPFSPCANTTTPSFPRRPPGFHPRAFASSSPTPPGSPLARQPRLSPRERGCGGDAARAFGWDTCSNASPGQGRFHRGQGGVSSPPSSRHPPPPPFRVISRGEEGS